MWLYMNTTILSNTEISDLIELEYSSMRPKTSDLAKNHDAKNIYTFLNSARVIIMTEKTITYRHVSRQVVRTVLIGQSCAPCYNKWEHDLSEVDKRT